MSAAPLDPETGKEASSELMRFLPIGAAGMLARILLSDERIGFWRALAKVTAAGAIGCAVGLLAQEYLQSANLRYAAVGIAGWFADKLMDLAGRWIDAKGEAKIAEARGKTAKGKRKGKR